METFFLENNSATTKSEDFSVLLFEQFLLEEEIEYNELIQEMMIVESEIILNESSSGEVKMGERSRFALRTFFERITSSLNNHWQKIKLFVNTVLSNFSALLGDIRTSVIQLSKNLPKSFIKKDRTYFIFNSELKRIPKMMRDLQGAKTEKDLKGLDKGRQYKFNYKNHEKTSNIEDVVKFYRDAEDLVLDIRKKLMNLEKDTEHAMKISERGLRDIADLEKLKDRDTFERFKTYKEEISFYRMKISTSSRMATRMISPIYHLTSRTSSSIAGELDVAKSGRAGRELVHSDFTSKVNMLVSTGVMTAVQAALAIKAVSNFSTYTNLLKRLILVVP